MATWTAAPSVRNRITQRLAIFDVTRSPGFGATTSRDLISTQRRQMFILMHVHLVVRKTLWNNLSFPVRTEWIKLVECIASQ